MVFYPNLQVVINYIFHSLIHGFFDNQTGILFKTPRLLSVHTYEIDQLLAFEKSPPNLSKCNFYANGSGFPIDMKFSFGFKVLVNSWLTLFLAFSLSLLAGHITETF